MIFFYETDMTCTYQKSNGCRDWTIMLEHYQQTLKRKPGALPTSLAYSQMKEEFQLHYEKYFSQIEVLSNFLFI